MKRVEQDVLANHATAVLHGTQSVAYDLYLLLPLRSAWVWLIWAGLGPRPSVQIRSILCASHSSGTSKFPRACTSHGHGRSEEWEPQT